jgi:hypothetical protein
MANVTFGTSSINKPTPSGINLWVRVITVTIGVFLAWMLTNDIIPADLQKTIGAILGGILTLINSLAPLFGINVSPDEKVEAKEVTSMDTPKSS